MKPTENRQLELVSRRQSREGDLEAVAGRKRLIDVTHDVHLRVLAALGLPPQDRIIEEAIVVGVETAFKCC